MRFERYLIDTNILIYRVTDEGMLTAEVMDIFKDTTNRIYVPSKCVEELIYLVQSGRVVDDRWKSAKDVVDSIINDLQFEIKYIAEEHLRTLAGLPIFADHKDPTDRIIIAQAITEKTPIVSSDRKFNDYRQVGLKFVFNKR